jgi:phenol 2-monooxygenase
MQTTHVDVLIVGGGPAGLLCAIALNKVGHNVRIVDKRAEKLVGGRADGLMSRTLEVLQVRELGFGSCGIPLSDDCL